MLLFVGIEHLLLFDVLEKYGELIYNFNYSYIINSIYLGDENLDEKTFCLCR